LPRLQRQETNYSKKQMRAIEHPTLNSAGRLLFPVLLFFLALPAVLAAQQEIEPQQVREWRLTADKIEASRETQTVEATGDVLLVQGENYLKAEYARYYRETGWVYLRGEVEARWREDLLWAEEAEFDLTNRVGWLKNGTIFVAGPHLYFTGENIRKEGPETYSFDKAEITSCDGDPPAWSIATAEGEITIDGYAKLKHTRLNLLDQPVFYTPYFIIPAKKNRQSGLLFPEFGTSSRLGTYINQPAYWAISDESDATFYEYYMSDRGLMHGLEYRHTQDPETKGYWRFDWLYDGKTAETELDEDDQFDDDDLVRPNRVRYWWRSKLDTHLPGATEWKFKLDADYVSDQNYLREFDEGLSGYELSRETFLEHFSRDIENVDALERSSTALLTRSWDDFGVSAMAEYVQNLRHLNGNRDEDRSPSVQTMPEIGAYLYKNELFSGPLEYEVSATASNFMREHGTSGQRLDLRPLVSLPFNYGGVTFIPEVGARETIYSVDVWGNRTRSEHDDDFTHRFLPEAQVTAFTGFYNIFDWPWQEELAVDADRAGDSEWTRIKHTIQPRVTYDWNPFVSQSEKPEFDEIDRIEPVNELTYSLTNVLARRKETVALSGGAKGEAEPYLAVDRMEFLRLRLEQSYDFREAGRTEDRDEFPRRPFSDFLAEAVVSPDKYVSLTSRTLFSPYLGEVTEHDHFLRLSYPEKGYLDFGINFVREMDEFKRQTEKLRILHFGAQYAITDRWSAGFAYRADLVDDTDLEKSVTVGYNHQCFGLALTFTRTPFEDRFSLDVKLVGINF
jgi:LPS-assembly protein